MYTSTCLPSNLFREFSWQEPTCDGVLLLVTFFHIQMFKQTCRHYQSFRFMISITDFCPLWVGTIQFNLVSKLWHFLIILRPRACSVNTLSQILLLVMESVSCLFFLIFFFCAIKVIWYARVRNIKVHTVSPKNEKWHRRPTPQSKFPRSILIIAAVTSYHIYHL